MRVLRSVFVLSLSLVSALLNACDHRTLAEKVDPNTVPGITAAQLSAHNNESDCWIRIDDDVYNVTNFISMHPGGRQKLISHCGIDATADFAAVGHSDTALTKRAALLAAKIVLGLTGNRVNDSEQ